MIGWVVFGIVLAALLIHAHLEDRSHKRRMEHYNKALEEAFKLIANPPKFPELKKPGEGR